MESVHVTLGNDVLPKRISVHGSVARRRTTWTGSVKSELTKAARKCGVDASYAAQHPLAADGG